MVPKKRRKKIMTVDVEQEKDLFNQALVQTFLWICLILFSSASSCRSSNSLSQQDWTLSLFLCQWQIIIIIIIQDVYIPSFIGACIIMVNIEKKRRKLPWKSQHQLKEKSMEMVLVIEKKKDVSITIECTMISIDYAITEVNWIT
jgi:hypothetical protein